MNRNKIYNKDIEELIYKGVKNIKEKTIILNDGKPIFDKQDYELIEGEPVYFDLDEYGRSNGAVAIISKNTIPLVMKKKLRYPDPYGWTKSLENKDVFERCHIIAYSLSAKFADKKNIFIGTETLNTSIMASIEKKIKNYIINNDVKILYRVTMKYKGIDQIPTGILIESQSIDDEFSVCEFCYNVQEKVKFSYKDGTIIEDNRFLRKTKNKVKKLFETMSKKKSTEKNKDYIINRRTNEFHLKDAKCNNLKNTKPKYLNETTATEKDLLNAKLQQCDDCI